MAGLKGIPTFGGAEPSIQTSVEMAEHLAIMGGDSSYESDNRNWRRWFLDFVGSKSSDCGYSTGK